MARSSRILVALSGGVDSAVAALLLAERGYAVECLHMSNWDDDDGYCDAAADLADARSVCDTLGLPLHRVNFAREYRDAVFADFLAESRAGRTPNPDVLCNREIKFGVMLDYARRLGAAQLATGHYARLGELEGHRILLKGVDTNKDQSYFLHAVDSRQFADVLFPLGGYTKAQVRELARQRGLAVAGKRDSTGICFIGERPFEDFLQRYIAPDPGRIVTENGDVIGEHQGLHFYTIGQRKGLGVGGIDFAGDAAWYVAEKRRRTNELVVVQGGNHAALFSDWMETGKIHWIGPAPAAWLDGQAVAVNVKTRYRQSDQACRLLRQTGDRVAVAFDEPQRAVTAGQYAVFYTGDRCLGGARIERVGRGDTFGSDGEDAEPSIRTSAIRSAGIA